MAIWHVAPLRFAPVFRALGVCEHIWLRYRNFECSNLIGRNQFIPLRHTMVAKLIRVRRIEESPSHGLLALFCVFFCVLKEKETRAKTVLGKLCILYFSEKDMLCNPFTHFVLIRKRHVSIARIQYANFVFLRKRGAERLQQLAGFDMNLEVNTVAS